MKKYAITFCMMTLGLIACNEKIKLKQISISSNDSLFKVDSNERLQMSIYRVTKYKALGKMDIFHVIGKDSLFPQIAFEIVDGKNGTRISKDYVAITKAFGQKNWGWFQIKNGKPSDNLPNLHRIMDSLKSAYGKQYFISQSNGTINVFKGGIQVAWLDYGDLQYQYKSKPNTNIPPGLYTVNMKRLVPISTDPDDLFKQKNGVFYVPPPGYGIIKKVRKARLYFAVDSIFHLSFLPHNLIVLAE